MITEQGRASDREGLGPLSCEDNEPEVGVEPTTFRLRVECATTAPLGLGPACGLSGECSEGAPAPTNEFRAPPPSPFRAPPSPGPGLHPRPGPGLHPRRGPGRHPGGGPGLSAGAAALSRTA